LILPLPLSILNEEPLRAGGLKNVFRETRFMVKITPRESLPTGPKSDDAARAGIPAAEKSLYELRPGERGIVGKVEAEPALKLHLMELGFVAGSPIVFLMSTPFGDPNIYALRGTSIALRKSEAKCIRVRI
jgi:ferrous iron transport protein A